MHFPRDANTTGVGETLQPRRDIDASSAVCCFATNGRDGGGGLSLEPAQTCPPAALPRARLFESLGLAPVGNQNQSSIRKACHPVQRSSPSGMSARYQSVRR